MVELIAAGGREKNGTVVSDAACNFLNTWTLERERGRERKRERDFFFVSKIAFKYRTYSSYRRRRNLVFLSLFSTFYDARHVKLTGKYLQRHEKWSKLSRCVNNNKVVVYWQVPVFNTQVCQQMMFHGKFSQY